MNSKNCTPVKQEVVTSLPVIWLSNCIAWGHMPHNPMVYACAKELVFQHGHTVPIVVWMHVPLDGRI